MADVQEDKKIEEPVAETQTPPVQEDKGQDSVIENKDTEKQEEKNIEQTDKSEDFLYSEEFNNFYMAQNQFGYRPGPSTLESSIEWNKNNPDKALAPHEIDRSTPRWKLKDPDKVDDNKKDFHSWLAEKSTERRASLGDEFKEHGYDKLLAAMAEKDPAFKEYLGDKKGIKSAADYDSLMAGFTPKEKENGDKPKEAEDKSKDNNSFTVDGLEADAEVKKKEVEPEKEAPGWLKKYEAVYGKDVSLEQQAGGGTFTAKAGDKEHKIEHTSEDRVKMSKETPQELINACLKEAKAQGHETLDIGEKASDELKAKLMIAAMENEMKLNKEINPADLKDLTPETQKALDEAVKKKEEKAKETEGKSQKTGENSQENEGNPGQDADHSAKTEKGQAMAKIRETLRQKRAQHGQENASLSREELEGIGVTASKDMEAVQAARGLIRANKGAVKAEDGVSNYNNAVETVGKRQGKTDEAIKNRQIGNIKGNDGR